MSARGHQGGEVQSAAKSQDRLGYRNAGPTSTVDELLSAVQRPFGLVVVEVHPSVPQPVRRSSSAIFISKLIRKSGLLGPVNAANIPERMLTTSWRHLGQPTIASCA